MKVFAYHNSNNGVSHYRVWQPMAKLAQAGFDVKRLPDRLETVLMPFDGEGGNVPGCESHDVVTKWADVLFSNFRRTTEDTMRLCVQAQLKPLVLDIDDDVECIGPDNPAWKDWQAPLDGDAVVEVPLDAKDEDLEARKKEGWTLVRDPNTNKRYLTMLTGMTGWENVKEQLQAAHVVTVSTDYLADIYRKYNKNVVVVPNAIDFDVWKRSEIAPDRDADGNRRQIRIGLFGSNSHYKDWAVCADAVKRILDEYPHVTFVFNGWMIVTEKLAPGKRLYEAERHFRVPDYFQRLGFMDHPRVEICESVEVQDYPKWLMGQKLDIGLAPLVDNRFNRAKSNLKFIEFGAMGIPAVYADVEAYKDVQHGTTGLKASKPEDYYKQLKKLVESEDVRCTIGALAHKYVRENYDAAKVADKLAGAIRLAKEIKDNEKAVA